MRFFSQTLVFTVGCFLLSNVADAAWRRHVVDATSQGADGARLGDTNRDGRPDIVTGWEEGGKIRAYLNPGPKGVTAPWPLINVADLSAPEDAMFVDLDGDGQLDVVSACEGTNRAIYASFSPRERTDVSDAAKWTTGVFPATRDAGSWMFTQAMQIDGRHGVDLVVGSKGDDAMIGWLQAPENAHRLDQWRLHKIYDAGWIMSLELLDMDADGDLDVLASDRKGGSRGVLWLENPGEANAAGGAEWPVHRVGATDREVMFLHAADLDRDGGVDIAVATRDGVIELFRRLDADGDGWRRVTVPNPFGVKNGKAVAAGDIDLDGRMDFVHTANTGDAPDDRGRPGVAWMRGGRAPFSDDWTAHDISGPDGVKFDRIELIDLDGDGDLDVLTCEERANLGVIWYENPTR